MNLFKKNFMKRMAFAAGILPFVLALLYFSACRNNEPNGGDEDKTPPAEVTSLNGIGASREADSDTVKNTNLAQSTIFPLGEPVNPQWFIGKAWLKMLSADNPFNTPVANVTFAPGARNHWHSHKVGQILLVTGGEGWYQEWGKPAQKLKEGAVVNIPANVKHWHGAAKDSWFVHLAINSGESEWFEPVADEAYNNLTQVSVK